MKYFLSLCVIVTSYEDLEEFIIYYWAQGVEHFYIYDNCSEIQIKNILTNYFYKTMCTIIHYPGKYQNINCYNNCLENYGKYSDWIFFVESNEFVLPKKHSTFREFLKEMIEDNNTHAIGINIVMFGSGFNEKRHNGYLIDKYRYCFHKEDSKIKTVCGSDFTLRFKNKYYVELKEHCNYYDPQKKEIFNCFHQNDGNTDIIQINHYTKSVEEILNNNKNNKLIKEVDLNKINNEVRDNTIAEKYLPIIKRLLKIVNANWEVYKLLNSDLNFNDPNKYYEHLFKSGINEKRPIEMADKYPGFSIELYRNNYLDLQMMSDLELMNHYIKFGINEKRVANKDIK